MCGTQYALALLAVYVTGLAHSWDIAISVGDRLEFYTNGTKRDTVHLNSHNLTAIAYDEVHNMMLFVDKQSDNDAICGYNLASMEIRCFIKRYGSNIQDLAFDPASDKLFFTDTKEASIYWISLKDQGSANNVYHENLLINVDNQTVSNIAVDSCRGHIYWTYIYKKPGVYMERARFNGSKRKVIYEYLPIYSVAIDPQTHTNYFIDGSESISMEFLRKADLNKKYLNGESEKAEIIYVFKNQPLAPKELTVSNDYLYWMNSSVSHTTVWQATKNATGFVKPREICKYNNERPISIAANYRIREQVQALQDCKALSSLIPIITAVNNAQNTEKAQQKPHTTETEQATETDQRTETEQTTGTEKIAATATEKDQTEKREQKTEYAAEVKCTPGYIGESCYVSVCDNYCLQGNCTFNDDGFPECRCNAGYFGNRCEVKACNGYCLNNGDCSLNENSDPICQCRGNYTGDRCEVSGCLNYCFQGFCSFNAEGQPICRCNAGYSGVRCEVAACQCGNHKGFRCEVVKNDTVTNIFLYDTAKRNQTLTDLLLTLHYTSN